MSTNGTPISTNNRAENAEENVLTDYTGLNPQAKWELQQARAATSRYRNIANAVRDGYIDISVVVQEMGYHYLKAGILDSNFEFDKPELLVYNKDDNGNFELVAVEYAVPHVLSPSAPPSGFKGDDDIWVHNTQFDLWTLHAWVWSFNPLGVFNATNPLVHVH
jgi:hypothetical protein